MGNRERRKHQRQEIREGVVALIKEGRLQVAKINDVCEEGLSFFYEGRGEVEHGQKIKMDILFTEEDIFWPQVNCSVISDEAMSQQMIAGIQFKRRCGVRFEGLRPAQLAKLKSEVL